MQNNEEPTTCFLCNSDLDHAEVVIQGESKDGALMYVQPNCLDQKFADKIGKLSFVKIIIKDNKPVSAAKQIVVKKRLKEIRKAIDEANARQITREAEKQLQAPVA